MRRFPVVGVMVSLGSACNGGQTSIGAHDFGLAAGVGASGGADAFAGMSAGTSGAGGLSEPCAWSGENGLVAEWRANGNLDNVVVCSPLQAEISGQVAYGPGREAQAWQLRSTWTSVEGGDPNFIQLAKVEDVTLPQVTLDVWVQQTGFNDYKNSNRIIFSTSYRPINAMLPGELQLYVHENKTYLAFFKTGTGDVDGVDSRGCYFRSLGPPDAPAPLDTWLRLSVTYDGSALRCFLNGSLEEENPLLMKEPASAELAPLIGRNYPGDVDALRLFNRALSPDELAVPWP